jgi:hypothetical protein
MPDSQAQRARRSRAHRAGDHSLCTGRCAVVRAAAGGSSRNGVPDSTGPVSASVNAYVESLRLDDSDARSVMAACARRLAEAFDGSPNRDIPAVSRELRTSLSWLAQAEEAGNALDEIRSRRLLRRTNLILDQVDMERAQVRSGSWPVTDAGA